MATGTGPNSKVSPPGLGRPLCLLKLYGAILSGTRDYRQQREILNPKLKLNQYMEELNENERLANLKCRVREVCGCAETVQTQK
jgi:hypothetical protein